MFNCYMNCRGTISNVLQAEVGPKQGSTGERMRMNQLGVGLSKMSNSKITEVLDLKV